MTLDKVFTISRLPDLEFKSANLSAIQFLALKNVVNLQSFAQTEFVFKFILEHLLVKINGVWVTLKEKDKEIYMPINLGDNLPALEEICYTYINEILLPLFMKSNE